MKSFYFYGMAYLWKFHTKTTNKVYQFISILYTHPIQSKLFSTYYTFNDRLQGACYIQFCSPLTNVCSGWYGRKVECVKETHTEEMVRHQPTYITGNILVELFSPRQLYIYIYILFAVILVQYLSHTSIASTVKKLILDISAPFATLQITDYIWQ